jgi:hypothetical protein
MPAQTRLKTALSERFGLDVPIFGFSHSVAVTAAISNAGCRSRGHARAARVRRLSG